MNVRFMTLALAAVVTGALSAGPAAVAGEDAVVRGGRLYDNWYRELHLPPPREPHPLLAETVTGAGAGAAASWRCATCHGWDYRGAAGMSGIERFRGADPAAVIAILTAADHGYGDILRPDELLDLGDDPGEKRDVGSSNRPLRQAMRNVLEDTIASRPHPVAPAVTVDDETRSKLEALGYVE